MRSKTGIRIECISPGSPAEKAGLRPGDVLLSANSHSLHDVVDFMFHSTAGQLGLEYSRAGAVNTSTVELGENDSMGITFLPFKVKTCRNNCVFCFVRQLPGGLRRSLYIKDEDYRLSFLYGNYMTLSNISAADRKRIAEQRLSPLYISVHTTNRSLRNKMLGNPKATDIMKELKFFADHKIRLHTQIVLCPGLNDGKELQKTISDLFRFYPYVSSIAVVPVGLTVHRKQQLTAVSKEDASRTIATVESFQKRFKKKHGDPIVFCSDEMYIKAEQTFPALKEYGNLSQLENGVGMVPLFLNQARRIKAQKTSGKAKRVVTFTGTSFYPILRRFTDRLAEKEGLQVTVLPVENRFFGATVTVAGLLTGRDVIKTIQDHADSADMLLVPDVALREDQDIFLDDVALGDIEEATGLKTVRIESTPQGLVDALTEG